MDYVMHAANVLLLAAYIARDILWLRVLAVLSSLVALPYFLLQPTPLWEAVGWSVVLTAVNVFQISRLMTERRPVPLTFEEEQVHRRIFRGLPAKQFLRLLHAGSWRFSPSGERLIERGRGIDSISLIVRGRVQLSTAGHVIGDLGPADIVGSPLLVGGVMPDVDGVAMEPTRAIRWDAEQLQRHFDANPETHSYFKRHLARRLQHVRQA